MKALGKKEPRYDTTKDMCRIWKDHYRQTIIEAIEELKERDEIYKYGYCKEGCGICELIKKLKVSIGEGDLNDDDKKQ